MTASGYSVLPMGAGIYRAFQYQVWVNGKLEGERAWTPVYRFDGVDQMILAVARWYAWKHAHHESPIVAVPEIVRPQGPWLNNHVEMPIVDIYTQEHGLAIWSEGARVGYLPTHTRFTRIDGEVWALGTMGRGELTRYTGPALPDEEVEHLMPAGN